MDRRAFLALFALVGCSPKAPEPKVVTMPPGLSREDREKATHEQPKSERSEETTGKMETAVQSESAPSTGASVVRRSVPERRLVPPPAIQGTASTAIVQTSPAMPERPKADESHALGYRIKEGAIELEGVCRFDEQEVACWDGKGADLPSLKAQIETALTTDAGGYNSLSLRFKKKNRIVVVRQEQMPMSQNAPQRNLSLMEVGNDLRNMGGGSLSLPSEGFAGPDKPSVGFQARVMPFESNDRETQMRIMVSDPIPNPPDIELRKGATADYGGLRFKVESIQKGVPRNGPYFGPEAGEMWTVNLSWTGTAKRPASFNLTLNESLYRDAKGKLVDMATYQKWMSEAQRSGNFDYSKQPYRSVMLQGYGSTAQGRTIVAAVNIDPKLLKKARIYGSYQRTVDVTGIPLDPKPSR